MTYLWVLLGCLVVVAPLELAGARVLTRPRRLGLTLLPVASVFLGWDIAAVAAGDWTFDPAQVLPYRLLGLPVEEVLFFVVVPLCAVLTFETARRVSGWRAGDE